MNRTQTLNRLISYAEFEKEAGLGNDVINFVKKEFQGHYDENDKVGSAINFLGPGLATLLLGGWKGAILGSVLSALHIDLGSIISSMTSTLKPSIEKGTITPQEIDNAAETHVQGDVQSIKDVYARYNITLTPSEFIKEASLSKRSWLATLISLVFKTVLFSAGVMVAGDVGNKLVGRPNAIDNTLKANKPVEQKIPELKHFKLKSYTGSTPTLFHTKKDDKSKIEQGLIDIADKVYTNINEHKSQILASNDFQDLVEDIQDLNKYTGAVDWVGLPGKFHSDKQLVDSFIVPLDAKI